jgi:predicted DCC family thiol-disulfide oxidoreductase YuxK
MGFHSSRTSGIGFLGGRIRSGGILGDHAVSTTSNPERIGWVLYDDACGFCRRWIPFWTDTLRRRGLDIAPLQSRWVQARLNLPPDQALYDLRLLRADGTLISGADVYRFVLQRIWWAYPFYLISVTPLIRSLFDAAYRAFANHRVALSRACRLTPGPTDNPPTVGP